MEFKKDDNIYLPMDRVGPNGKPTDKIQLRQSPATDSDNKDPIRLYTRGEPVEVATKRDGSFIVKDKGKGKFALVKGFLDGDAIGYIQTKYLLNAGEAERASAAGHSMGAAAGSATYAPPLPSSAPPPPYAALPPHRPLTLFDMAAASYVPPVDPEGTPVVQMFFLDENGVRFTYGKDRKTRIYKKGGTRRRKYKGKGRGSKGKSKTARKSRNRKNRNRRSKSKSRN